jgi:putative colanic acid biosysnthesis UDP-glucose lipid carrier transferase
MEDRKLLSRRVLFFGDEHYVARLQKHIEKMEAPLMTIQGSFAGRIVQPDSSVDNNNLQKKLNEMIVHLRSQAVDDVVIALPWNASEVIQHVVERLRELPVNVYLGADSVGLEMPLRPARDSLRDAAVFEIIGQPLSGWDLIVKTLEDYILAATILILFSPLFLIIAILIRIDSPGPVFFKQKRYGFNNEIFEIFKFRTMIASAGTGARTRQAQPDDPRVTRIGRFLRKTSLDELPQLLNVLGGSMSLVGPRPHAVDHNEEYSRIIRGYFARHRVKPGVTGLAQVKGFRGLTDTIDKMESRVKYDIVYTENWSLMLDMKILLRTASVLFGSKNAF